MREVQLDSIADDERTVGKIAARFQELSTAEARRLLSYLRSVRRSGIGDDFKIQL